MNRKRTLIIILILLAGLFPLIPIPIAKATEATVSIERSEDDVWMTESGNIFGYEASVRILEPEIGIRSFLRFEDVPLLKSSKINYATLYVYAGWDQGETISPGASVTIYGIDEPDCAPFSYSGRVWSLERPYTTASVNWNVSDWHYSTWKSVNVTSIVKEIINQYAWTQNNSIGFQIIGASDSGYEYRTFEDIDHQHHGAYAYLYFNYDGVPETPPGLPDTAVWEETYGEVDIWSVPGEAGDLGYGLDPIEYTFSEGTSPYNLKYDNLTEEGPITIAVSFGLNRQIVRSDNGSIYAVYALTATAVIYVERSDDNGTTWSAPVDIRTGVPGLLGSQCTIAVDASDNLHVVFSGTSTGFPAKSQVWYILYNGTWQTPLRISTASDMDTHSHQSYAIVSIDSNDYVHVVWWGGETVFGSDQTWYTNFTDAWSTPLRIGAGTINRHPDIAIDINNDLHVVWHSLNIPYGVVYTKYNGSWSTPITISTYAGMDGTAQGDASIAIDSDEYLHVSWVGMATGFLTNPQIWYTNFTTTWAYPRRLSNYTAMNIADQESPNVAVNSTDDVHVMWHGKASGYGEYVVWHTSNKNGWLTPEVLQAVGRNKDPGMRWARFPIAGPPDDDTFYLVDENNTVIENWNGENETDIDDLKDWYDDYVDPGGGDPLDPDPGTQGWDTEGPFTRFNMRLYFLFIGLGCVFGPVWAMAYKKFDSVGYAWCFIVIVLGVGLLWSITGI